MAKPTPEELAAKEAAELEALAAAELEALAAAELEALAAIEQTIAADEDGKVLVETTGAFMLFDPLSGTEIEATGSTLVPMTSFIESRIDLGQLKLAS